MKWEKALQEAREQTLAQYSVNEIRKCDALQMADAITKLAQKIYNSSDTKWREPTDPDTNYLIGG